ncbi:DUF6603 domain-containing protein [Microbacterium sp. NPDC078428]|uniref:DUF6603 domain-containing protein n=1 Tax=Microbacterium sp. NPDC078428 TaxID=3364190 RepID=UPI0037CCB7F0
MASDELRAYVDALRARLAALGVDPGPLGALATAAQTIADLIDHPETVTEAAWRAAVAQWESARAAVIDALRKATLGTLAQIPVLNELTDDAELVTNGINADLDIGPVHVAVRTAVLYVDPPAVPGVELPPVPIGPFALGAIEASLAPPNSGGGVSLPGGGSLVRLPGGTAGAAERGWGGSISVPVPPVLVTASALLAVDGSDPSFLAVLGIQFLPPIQLSFGFALDRVGGIVGVNRNMDTDALRVAVRTGAAGDVLLQVRPPDDPLAVAGTLDRIFPRRTAVHVIGPSMRLTWLSVGPSGSMVSLDLVMVVQIPDGRVAILGVARIGIPGLPGVLNLRIDMLGLVDPVEKLVSIDASLVDSHVLGIFEIYGDAALRLSWGSEAYVVVSIGGFFPGFDPKPAKLPALRRVGMAQSVPGSGITLRVEGYFAVTANTVQLGGRIEAGISVAVLDARGFIETDAILQLRPFRFQARIAAGFSVSAGGFDFASVQLSGQISGPGPIVVRGSLSVSVFLFELEFDQTFTLGAGPADALPVAEAVLDVLAAEVARKENLHAENTTDRLVVLAPRKPVPGKALVPPTGTLLVQQKVLPLGLPISRLKGVPLTGLVGARITGAGADVRDSFAPGVFLTLTDAELVNRPPFDLLPAGKVLSPAEPDLGTFPHADEKRVLEQIVIDTRTGVERKVPSSAFLDLSAAFAMVSAARSEPALSDRTTVLSAVAEKWTVLGAGQVHESATEAHQWARAMGTTAVPSADLLAPVVLVGVL